MGSDWCLRDNDNFNKKTMMSPELFRKRKVSGADLAPYEDKIKNVCVSCGEKITRKRYKNKYSYYWNFGNFCEKCICVISNNVKDQKFEQERNIYEELLKKVVKLRN